MMFITANRSYATYMKPLCTMTLNSSTLRTSNLYKRKNTIKNTIILFFLGSAEIRIFLNYFIIKNIYK